MVSCREQVGVYWRQPESQHTALAMLDLNTPVERDCRPSGRRKRSSTLGAEGMDFEAASESLDGDRHIASLAGEVDLTSGPELERALFAMPEDGVASVVVDLTDCSVMDCTGLQLLSRAQRRLERSGGRLRVVSANRSVLRFFGITRLDQLFAVYSSRATALNGDGDD